MATNMNELRVPVSLQISNLQAIIDEIQSKMSNLKIGSKGFKEMDSLLSSLRREMDRLQIQTSKPFMSQNQFNAAERSVSKLEDGLERIQITMGRIKFTDLELDSSQLAQFKAYEDEIKNIKEAIKNVKETAKQEFLGGAGGAAWLGFSDKNVVAMNQSLSQITTAINSAFQSQVAAIDRAEAKLKDYQDQMALAGKLEGLQKGLGKTKTVEDLSKVLGNEYDKIFNSSGTAFKSGGKGILAQWLTQQFQLDESQVREYVQQSANKVLESLKNGELARAIDEKLTSVQGSASKMNGGSLQADVDAKKAKLEELRPALEGITAANNGLGAASDALNDKLSRTNEGFNQWKESVTAAARAKTNFDNEIKRGNSTLDQFKTQLASTNTQFLQLERAQRNFNSIKMAVTNFMGFTQVLNLTKRAVRDALNHIKELDSVMNKISIVTNMNTGDLWGQVDAYSDMAQKYGVSIKGAYEVSQIYYQQGLQTKDVLTLTNETLKLAKISGLDYASTTDYMTTALRGFKMEMSEASTVVDVYSNLAAHTAVTQEELAVAMSKTASSMESVGSSFEESSAMIATMVAVTRESATNIGSALKSIAARYGEMKNDPSKLIDSEGEVLAYNKVDAALQSVGITLKTTDGQFRNFTDVIIELGEKWDELDSTQQRYIATQFAGNRQQSRFLALVSNIDLLKSNLNYAEDSEDTGTLQALKALDSIESKTEQVRVAYQQMYTTIGAENIWKGLLDGTRNVINTMNGLPKLFGKIPIGAIAMAADIIKVIKDLGLKALGGISAIWAKILPDNVMEEKGQAAGRAFANAIKGAITESSDGLKEAGREAAIKTAEGAKEAQQDATTPAKQATDKQKQEVAAPATAPAIQAAEQSQQLANAAANAEQLANNQERAAEAAERQAAANSLNASSTEEQVAALSASGYSEAFQSEVGFLHLDWDNLTEQSEAALVRLIASVANASDQLRAAFSAAGDDAIAGFVAGLLRGCGASADAASSVGKTSVEAIRTAIQSHSPSKATEQIGNDFVQGYILGIAAQGDKAIASGKGVGQATLDGLNEALNEKSFEKLKTGLLEGIDQALAGVQPKDMSDADWRIQQMSLAEERKAIAGTTFAQFQSGAGEAADIFNMFAKQMENGRSDVAAYLAAKQQVWDKHSSPEMRAQTNAITYPMIQTADPEAKGALGAVSRTYQQVSSRWGREAHLARDAYIFNGEKPNIHSSNQAERIGAINAVRSEAREQREGEFGTGLGQDSARIHRIFNNAYDIRAEEAARIKEETDKAYKQAEAQQAAEDKARAEATNNPLWDKDAQEQAKNNPQLTTAEEEQKWRAELAQMDADVKLRLDTTEAKQEAEEFKTATESQPVEEKLQTTSSNGLSVDEQIAKWQQLKEINEQLQEAQKNQDTSKIDELSQKQWATASALGIGQGYKSFVPEEIDSQISKLRGESNITLETHADTTPIQEEVKETKEKLEAEPVQMSMFDTTSTGGNPIDPVLARQQELLQFYGGNKNAMFAQMGNSDEELRAAAERGAQSPEQAEINFQALKGLQEQRIETYNQEIEALNRLKAARAELDSISKKENPEAWAEKNAAFQDARRAYQDISGEKLNSNLGQQKIQEQIDSITAKRDLIVEPQVKINPEEVTKPIEEAPPVKVPVEPQQVKMDLDHPGQDNFVYVTPKIDESAVPQMQQEIQQGVEQVNGQISLGDAIQSRVEEVKQQIEQLKQALEELNNYTFDEKSGNFTNGNKSMSEADYMALRSKYTTQIGALSNEQQGLQNMMNPGAAPIEAPPVDMSATQEQIQGCIDKLVEMGAMSQQAGDALKDGLQGASPEELKAKLEELKAKVQEVGETSTSAGSKMKAAFSKNAGSLGAAMSMLASLFDKTSRGGQQAAGSIMAIGGAIRIVDALSKAAAGSNPWMALAMGIMAVVNGISMFIEDDSEKLERLNQQAEKTANASKEAKSEYKDLKSSVDKIEELKEKRYESAEAAEEYQSAVESLTDKFPGLIAGFDSAGNAILDVKSAEEQLTAARTKAARAAIEAANDAKKARAQEMKTKANEMIASNLAGHQASWQIGQWDNTGAVSTSTYQQVDTEFGKTTQALAEMGGWNNNSSVMQYMMTGGTLGRFSPLWDAENNQYVVDEGEVQRYVFWGADALENPESLDIIKQHTMGTAFNTEDWSGLQGEMSEFYGQGIEAIHAIPGEMTKISDSTKTYLTSMTDETLAYNKNIVDQYGQASAGARFSRIDSVLPFVDGKLVNKEGTDYLRQFTGFGNAAFVEAKALAHESADFEKDPARQAYLNGKGSYDVDYSNVGDADWREVTIEAVRQKKGDTAANNLSRFLLGTDAKGNSYFNGSEWEGNGNTEATGAVGQLLTLVQKNAKEGSTYNAEFFFNALQPLVEFLGSDWMTEHGFGDAWGEVAQMMEYIRDAKKLNRSDDLTMLSESTNLLAAAHTDDHTYDFISQSSGLSSIMYSQMLDSEAGAQVLRAIENEEDPALAMYTYGNDIITAYSEFYDQFAGRMSEDGEELTTVFERMLSDTENYSDADIIAWCDKYGIKVDGVVKEALEQRLDKTSEYYEGLLDSNLNNNKEKYKDSKAFETLDTFLHNGEYAIGEGGREYTKSETNYFSKVIAQASKMTDSGFSDVAKAYTDNAIGLFQQLDGETAEVKKAVLASIAKNGINTREGINKVIADAKAAGMEDTTWLEQMRDSLVTNLNLAIQTMTSELMEDWKDSGKTLKKLTSGIDFTEVQGMLDMAEGFTEIDGKKFTLSRSDFKANGDKLVLSEEKAVEYWQYYSATMYAQADEWERTLNEAMTGLGAINEESFTEEWATNLKLDDENVRKWLSTISGGKTDALIVKGDNGKWTADPAKILTAVQEGHKIVSDGITDYRAYLDYAGAQVIKTTQWAKGNYSSLKTIFGFTEADNTRLKTRLENLLSGTGEGEDSLEHWADEPDVKNAVKQIRSKISSFVSDVIAKGFDQIDLSDYEGLPDWIVSEWKNQDHSESMYDFAKKYVKYLGNDLEASNDMIITALEKDRKKTSQDVIKDLTFLNDSQFTATGNELKEFANTFGLDLVTLIENGIVYYDDILGEYVVNYTKIEGLDLSQVQGFQDVVQDSINDFFKKLGDLVKKGLTGSLTNADVTLLKEYLASTGYDFNKPGNQLDFTKTANGLKLSEQSALKLYEHLKATDSLQATLVFDELSKNLKASDEHYTSASANAVRQAELQQKVDIGRHNYETKRGNVDLVAHARHQISADTMRAKGYTDFEEGSYATLYSSTETAEAFGVDLPVAVNITPITNDGKVLTPDEVNSYMEEILTESKNTGKSVLELDYKGIVLDEKSLAGLDEAQRSTVLSDMAADMVRIHNESAAIAENMDEWDQPNNARIEQYERELELAKEIAQERATTEDSSFDFMSNKIPGAQNNPLKYFESWGKAWKTLKDSFETSGADKGLIGYQDFYNIMTEMGNIAAKSGVPIQLGAGEFVDSAEKASALIEKGAQCLTVASDGSIKVDLGKFGIDFAGGAEEMKGNINDGIKAMAQSQVEMLDSMIQLMETIVAMEKLEDVDVDANSKLDLGEIFDFGNLDAATENLDKITGFTEKYRESIQKLIEWGNSKEGEGFKKSAEAMKISWNGANISMWDLITTSEQTVMGWTSEMKGQYAAIISAFYQAAKSGDYNPDNIMKSIKDVLAGTGFEGEITIGDMTLTFQYDTVLEKGKDGKYHVGDKTFPGTDAGAKAAAKYQHQTDLDTLQGAATEEADNGSINYKNSIVSNVDYNVETGVYNITFSDGSTATATSKAGANLAIATFAKLTEQDIVSSPEAGSDAITFTIHQKGKANLEFTVENGEVTVKADGAGDASNMTKAKEAAQTVVDDEAQKAAEAASNTTGTAEISGLNVTLTGDAKPTIDLTGHTIEVTGLPTEAEVKDTPTLKYTGDADSFKLDLSDKTIEATVSNEVDAKLPEGSSEYKLATDIAKVTGATTVLEVTPAKIDLPANTVVKLTDNVNAIATANQLEVGANLSTETKLKVEEEAPQFDVGEIDTPIYGTATKLELDTIDTVDIAENVALSLNDPVAVMGMISSLQLSPAPLMDTILDTEEEEAEPIDVGVIKTTLIGEAQAIEIESAETIKLINSYVELTDTIPEITGKATLLKISAATTSVDGLLDASNIDVSAKEVPIAVKVDKEQAEKDLESIQKTADETGKKQPEVKATTKDDGASSTLEELIKLAQQLERIDPHIYATITDSASGIINKIIDRLKALNGTVVYATIKAKAEVSGTGKAAGTLGIAKAGGGTLMGELGPELVVSNGRYFVVGQNGPEMVNLAKDAIVFNHLQTKSLLEKGMSPTRGQAITNERVAASFAKGNINGGPAMASASSVLATLKQLKAQWEALAKLDVGSLAGAGGGGGGGGGGNDKAARASWIKEVERWYNLMQKIAQCEKDITHEETLRTKLNSDFRKNGKAYYDSQLQSLRLLQEQMVAQETLNISKREYFEQRREQLNTANGPFNQLYSFDENGQLKYNDTQKLQIGNGQTVTGGLAFLSEIMKRDEMNKPKYSAEEQYNMLVANGFKDFMLYDSSGGEILPPEEKEGEKTDLTAWYTKSIQALFDHMDSQKEEMQNLHDSIEDGENKMLELQSDQNEILEEIRNNQMAVEESLLDAIIDQRQRAIDNLSDERDALEKSTQKYIEGLSDALNKERDMYQQNESSEELNRMRRQLAILQRSGGSGSEIRSLQDSIRTKEQDTYFEEQQRQIDAIQEASDLQLERLDAQIDLMTETLEYEKDYGLLWEAVYQKMAATPEEITSFIMDENSKYWALSPLKTDTEFQNALFQAEQWVAFRESQNEQLSNIYAKTADGMTISEAVYGADGSWNIFTTAMTDLYGDQWTKLANDYKPIFQTQMAQTGDITKADVTTNQTIRDELGKLGDNLVSALSKPDPVSPGSSGGGGSGDSGGNGGGNTPTKKPTKTTTTTTEYYATFDNHMGTTKKVGPYKTEAEAQAAAKQQINADYAAYHKKYPSAPQAGVGDAKRMDTASIKTDKKTVKKKARGGFVNHGLYELGELGTETVLTAEQTKILRDNILSDRPNSLINLLKSYNEAYQGLSNDTYNSISDNREEAIVIEHAEVNMNVKEIANDYDAQRAGEQAMSKILEIARKTSAKNSIRR